MTTWFYIRTALVVASFIAGLVGVQRGVADVGLSPLQITLAAFGFGVIGMLFVVGIQAFNPRSARYWRYPSWVGNPFTFREPLQFFHFGGYFFFAAGIGGLLRIAFDRSTPFVESLVFTFWGGGIVVGVWLCAVLFRWKMLRAVSPAA